MAYTKIEDLPEITELALNEELIIQTTTGTKRIKANLLKDEELAQKVNELESSLNSITASTKINQIIFRGKICFCIWLF